MCKSLFIDEFGVSGSISTAFTDFDSDLT